MKTSIMGTLFFLMYYTGVAQEIPQQVDSQLFSGEGDNQPLIVALGGADGGNPWAGERVREKREQLLAKGYAFLAIGYFGTENTPEVLDRISLDAIHNAITEAVKNPRISEKKIAVVGVSKGAELALLLASHFDDITCVIAMAGSHCAFPAHTLTASTSSWTYQGREIPYVPMKQEAIPALVEHDLHSAFSIMLQDKEAVEKALIEVENINGAVLLLSAKNDEQWPSTKMSEEVVKRLEQNNFPHPYKHVAIDGGHFEVFDHFETIYDFLDQHFPVN